MEVICATAMGMCFGVRDALKIVGQVEDPARVTIRGELVHNEEILADLDRRGFRAVPEAARDAIPDSPEILITAHGVSNRERQQLLTAGKTLIDTTCPLVRHVHEAAQRLHREGAFVIVIGKPNHVEVLGIVGDLERYAVVATVDEVARYDAPRLGIVCQSTTPPAEAERIRRAIEARNPGKPIRYIDTICRPTRDRQDAAAALLSQVEAVVVVGGSHSNNTRQLTRLAQERGVPVVQVRSAAELDPAWFTPYRVVGLTAGTSTLDRTIDEVHRALLAIPGAEEPRRRSRPAPLSSAR
jgi:4-hydroxy-3-methylbut-2-en-1-yl diphosphate reductase